MLHRHHPHHFTLRLPEEATHELRKRLRHDKDVPSSDDALESIDADIDPTLLFSDASLACVMFLESEVPVSDRVAGRGGRLTSETSAMTEVLTNVLDTLVRTFQPSPHVLHSELLLVSATGDCRHFATYVGDEAGWRDRGAEYYRAHRWRGVPVDGGDGVERIVTECTAEIGTSYSLARYALSTPLFSWMSRAVRMRPRDPAHCGGLTARIVQNALGERGAALLPLASTRYSPSDLYNGLCARADTMDFDSSDAMLQDGEILVAANLLLTGTDAEVGQLGGRRRAEALKALAVRMNVALADPRGVTESQRTHHARAFGWAATRVADSFASQDANQPTPWNAGSEGNEASPLVL